MRLRLRWVVIAPVALAVTAWVVMWLLERLGRHDIDDKAYWGAAVSWALNAAWVAGVVGSVVAVANVLPAVLLFRLARRTFPKREGRPIVIPSDDPRRWRDERFPPRV